MPQLSKHSHQGVRCWDAAAAERRRAPFPGGPSVRVVVGPADGAPVGVLEMTMQVGGAMPEHDHGASAVLLAPLAGQVRLVESGGGPADTLRPGTVATIPVGVRVRLENTGDTEARTLVVLTPPDFAEHLDSWPADAPAHE